MPFKGEAFPAYVTQRMARKETPTRFDQRPPHFHTAAVTGPSAEDVSRNAVASSPPETLLRSPPAAAISIRKPGAQSFQPPPKTPSRPSLSDQLKTISQNAQGITSQLRTTYRLAQPESSLNTTYRQSSGLGPAAATAYAGYLLQATTIQLTVGRLNCRFPCPVHLATDHCSYIFQHPFEAIEVHMMIYYRDMRQLQFSTAERSLKFRIDRELDKFNDDYQPGNPQHLLKIVFATPTEFQRVKKLLASLKAAFGPGHNTV